MNLYYAFGHLVSPGAVVLFGMISRFTHTPRVRIFVQNSDGEILLLKCWIGTQQWEMPGGGVGSHESPKAAALRELAEETGIQVTTRECHYLTTLSAVAYRAPIYGVKVSKNQANSTWRHRREISQLAWFTPDKLPADLSPLVRRTLQMLPKKP